MPVTPGHAALALPLSRAAPALPLAPLVIGTLSPDFEYLLWLSPTGRFAHSLLGLVVFCVPVSLLAWGMWRAIVTGPTNFRLRGPDMAPHSPYERTPRVACHRAPPRSWTLLIALAGIYSDRR